MSDDSSKSCGNMLISSFATQKNFKELGKGTSNETQ